MGHAVATALAGLVLFASGSFNVVMGLSIAFSLGGVVVIANLASTARVLVPNWEDELPPEARSVPVGGHTAAPTPAATGND